MKKSIVKKTVSLFLSVLMFMLVLSACGNNNGGSSTSLSEAPSTSADKRLKIGLVQFTEHPSLDTIREAFMSRLEEWETDETKVSIDYQNGGGDTANLNSICQKFVGDKVDIIVAIATPAAQIAVSAVKDTDIKVVFAAVNDPISSLGLKNPEKPEGNITGTSDKIPVSSTIDLALQVNPDLKTFGLLYNSGETNSVGAVEEAKAYCAEKKIEVIEGTVSNTSEIQQVVANLASQVDAIFTSTDNSIASNMPIVVESTKKEKVPFYAGADSMVKDGALAAIGIDYTKLGEETADQVQQLLVGKSVSEVPVKFFETYDTYINTTTLKDLEIDFPEEVLAGAIVFE